MAWKEYAEMYTSPPSSTSVHVLSKSVPLMSSFAMPAPTFLSGIAASAVAVRALTDSKYCSG